ncbi:MAG: flippase [Deltaproteobacteria bacterium]|nr:flippase [Deltaproteobacteria bacterium]
MKKEKREAKPGPRLVVSSLISTEAGHTLVRQTVNTTAEKSLLLTKDVAFNSILTNVSWLTFDKVFRIGIGILVGAWVARYLGPAQYGLLNYALSFTALFGVFAGLGLEGIVVRELVRFPEKTDIILGTTFYLRLIGGLIAFLLSVMTIFVFRSDDTLLLYLVTLCAGGFLFQSFLVIDLYYQAHIKSKYTVWAQTIAFTIISFTKILLIIKKASVLAFGVAAMIEIAITVFFLLLFFYLNKLSIRKWQFSSSTATHLLGACIPMIISFFATTISLRIGQIILFNLLDSTSLGIFNASSTIVEVFFFVPVVISTSIFPYFVNKNHNDTETYLHSKRNTFILFLAIALCISLSIHFFSDYIVSLLYGKHFAQSAYLLKYQVFGIIFVFHVSLRKKMLLVENKIRVVMIYSLLAGLFALPSYYLLIRSYGLFGAVAGFLLVWFFGAIVAPAFARRFKEDVLLIKGPTSS